MKRLLILILLTLLICTPAWGLSFWRMLFPPDDLYEAIIIDDFKFFEKGYTETYIFNPKYIEIYSLGIKCDEANVTWGYKFSGILKLELLENNNVVFEKITDKEESRFGPMDRATRVNFMYFEIPKRYRGSKELKLRLTVLEPDLQLKQFGSKIQLSIRVSAIP